MKLKKRQMAKTKRATKSKKKTSKKPKKRLSVRSKEPSKLKKVLLKFSLYQLSFLKLLDYLKNRKKIV